MFVSLFVLIHIVIGRSHVVGLFVCLFVCLCVCVLVCDGLFVVGLRVVHLLLVVGWFDCCCAPFAVVCLMLGLLFVCSFVCLFACWLVCLLL